jgi:putative ABC transport system permease protein
VKDTAKVFTQGGNLTVKFQTRGGVNISNAYCMLVEPAKMKDVAWYNPEILGAEYDKCLQDMAANPDKMYLSMDMKDKYNIKVGQHAILWVNDNAAIEGTVGGFIDLFPSYNIQETPNMIFGNIAAVGKNYIGPYEVWIKKDANFNEDAFFDSIDAKGYTSVLGGIVSYKNVTDAIDLEKSSSLLKGINGSMTLTFILTLLLSIIGYFIYWVLSIKGRELQFGVIRAMGMSRGKIYKMLIMEQLLISGAAMAVGFGIGTIATQLYVPLFQITQDAKDRIPPFQIVYDINDYFRLAIIFAVMLIAGITALGFYIRKLKINDAIKIGEE